MTQRTTLPLAGVQDHEWYKARPRNGRNSAGTLQSPLGQVFTTNSSMAFAQLSTIVTLALSVAHVAKAAPPPKVTCADGNVTANAVCCRQSTLWML